MSNQDFEKYAVTKRFNLRIADTWQKTFEEAVAQLGRPQGELRVLDYGCGDGKYFPFLIAQGFDAAKVHGVEVSKLRVDRCQEMGWSNARLLTQSAALPYEDGAFDLVNFMEVIEHIPREEGRRVIAELRRVLRPGGLLLISTPNYPIKRFYDLYDAFVHRKWMRLRDDPTHVTQFNHERLKGLLEAHFAAVVPRQFKPGFLYKKFPRPFFQHKLFFLCRA